jgi:hypothetical protein
MIKKIYYKKENSIVHQEVLVANQIYSEILEKKS